ncbi:MAG: hypothetical protein V4581_16815, partial [Bacteroidota bacterium]
MSFIKTLRSVFLLSVTDRDIAANEIRVNNFKRILYITTLALPINLFYIINFGLEAGRGTATEQYWRKGIIISHCCLFVVNAMLSATGFYLRRKKKQDSAAGGALIQAVFVLLPIWGAVTASIDQLVTSSIVAFFLTSIVSAIALLVRPLLALLYFAFTYLVFFIGLSITQHNPVLLLT